ncbi:carbohydrate-binding module 1 [Taxawa tesnikishii (nom. ined.)]|nr:carbohydrate-binding module 1 [Dothideales sp. JES 119]
MRNLALHSDPKLPNPFKFVDGSYVKNKKDWQCRQEEVSALFQRYELGTKPPRPDRVSASFSSPNLTITLTEAGKSLTFTPTISYPANGTAPYPAIIAFDGLSIPRPAGAAVITFAVSQFAQQNGPQSRGVGQFYDLYGSNATASALMAWAYGVSRIIDALEMTPSAKINPRKLAVTGCSRNGKGAMVAGAFDSRIALTIPQESGSGGDACWRLSDADLALGYVVQTASEIVGENVWFSESFNQFANHTDLLPFDHHQLAGLIAPRGLYATDNLDFVWLGINATYGCMKTAKLIFEAVGAPDHIGFSQDGNHSHCTFPPDQVGEITAFYDKFLFDEPANTNVLRTDGNYTFNESYWVDWSIPRARLY